MQNMLIACQVPNIPPADNHVATKTVLATIGSDLIDYRSFAKTEVGSIYWYLQLHSPLFLLLAFEVKAIGR